MMLLDMHTIILSNVVTDIVCFLVILALWRQSRERFEGMGLWALGFAFQTTALFLIILRGIIPDWMSVVLANTLVFTGLLLFFMGLEYFLDKKSNQTHNYILIAVFVCVHAFFSLVQPNQAVRNANSSAAVLFFCFQCMWLLFHRVAPGMRRLTFGVGMVFGAYCLVSIVRIAEFFVGQQSKDDYFQPGIFEPGVLVTYQMLFILLTYSLILMVNKRLLMEVLNQEEKFSKAFHSSPYAITLTRLSDGKIMEVNEGFVNITGYPFKEAIAKTTLGLHLWDREEDRKAMVEELSATGRVHGREAQFRKNSGEVITGIFSADIIPINNEKFILSSISDITERKRGETEREKLIHELQKALSEVKTLSGLFPICSFCKKIRDDQGYWNQIEAYIRERSDAEFSHSICPDCAKKHYPDLNLYED
jgi:PAS domain S-box-containing protein